MSRNCILAWLSLVTLTVSTLAAPSSRKAIQPAPDGHRFLFIVETSSATGRMQAETEAALFELIGSGVNQEMRPGDTYGLWTYGKEISAGEFPMQIWDSRNSSQLGTIAAAYLSEREFKSSGDVKRLMAAVQNVVHSISNLNIFIISNGDSPMTGTPFDKTINADYKAKRTERKEAKRPFVTTLVARDGWIIEGTVVVSGTPIRLPDRTVPALAEKKKPATAPATNAVTPQVVVTPSAPASNQVAAVVPPPVPPAPKPKVLQMITKTNMPAAAIVAAFPAPVSTPDPLPVTPAPAAVVANSTETAPPAAASVPATQPRESNVATPSVGSAPASLASTTSSSEEGANQPAPLESALAALLPKPVTVAAREKNPGTDLEPTPAIQAAANPVASSLPHGLMLAFGGALLTAAAFLLFVVFRRQRPNPGGSLITQSMNQR